MFTHVACYELQSGRSALWWAVHQRKHVQAITLTWYGADPMIQPRQLLSAFSLLTSKPAIHVPPVTGVDATHAITSISLPLTSHAAPLPASSSSSSSITLDHMRLSDIHASFSSAHSAGMNGIDQDESRRVTDSTVLHAMLIQLMRSAVTRGNRARTCLHPSRCVVTVGDDFRL